LHFAFRISNSALLTNPLFLNIIKNVSTLTIRMLTKGGFNA
jgi:hypothetical protein